MEEMEIQSMTANTNTVEQIQFNSPENYHGWSVDYQPEYQWVLPSVILDTYDNGVGSVLDRVQYRMPKDMTTEVLDCYALWLAAIPEGEEYDLIRSNMEKIVDDLTRVWEGFQDTTPPTMPTPPPPTEA